MQRLGWTIDHLRNSWQILSICISSSKELVIVQRGNHECRIRTTKSPEQYLCRYHTCLAKALIKDRRHEGLMPTVVTDILCAWGGFSVNNRPAYFDRIFEKTSKRWRQLEDPELVGPWWQLLEQVESPPHVLSELLQNADDAGASSATAAIDDGKFIFCHNGNDFTQADFSSLCSFAHSNKRTMNTIGFRGIGFKSTFSLGDEVSIATPTLRVTFRRSRFTLPIWDSKLDAVEGMTCISVALKDEYILQELERSFDEWLHNSTSLLFLKNIRRLDILGQSIIWDKLGEGPVANSERFIVSSRDDEELILIRSKNLELPSEAVEEVKKKRKFPDESIEQLPPCQVSIALGIDGRLYTFLPTDVKTDLPFAANAPFVQDPARDRIESPSKSATNRWLLSQIGILAADSLVSWVRREELNSQQRARAYDLMPDVNRDDNSLSGTCARIVQKAFESSTEGRDFLLCESGELAESRACISLPSKVLAIWSEDQLTSFFSSKADRILSRHVSAENMRKLQHWSLIEVISKQLILDNMRECHYPRPDSWEKLAFLWEFVSADVLGFNSDNAKEINIVPVQGSRTLHSANEVVRLGEKRLLNSDSDWNFIEDHIKVMNTKWSRFIARKREQNPSDQRTEKALQMLSAMSLLEATNPKSLMDSVAKEFFESSSKAPQDYVRLAQIFAKLNVAVSKSFRFITRDEKLRDVGKELFADMDHVLDKLITKRLYDEHCLHPMYSEIHTSCSTLEWKRWIKSPKSGVSTFLPIKRRRVPLHDISGLDEELGSRGAELPNELRYKNNDFVIDDWDFPEAQWTHWRQKATENESFWATLLNRIIAQGKRYWEKCLEADAYQISAKGNEAHVTSDTLLPGWILKFRETTCLLDTNGNTCQPAELLLRVPETDSLWGIEPFVDSSVDNESNRELLLALGVRDTPTGPERIIERLRALSEDDKPNISEVRKWYTSLDQLLNKCSTEEAKLITAFFKNERVVLTADEKWTSFKEVFLQNDDSEIPGVALVHPKFTELSLWRHIGIADRPTAERIIDWLRNLPTGRKLSPDEGSRVRSVLERFPFRTCAECKHWINLKNMWMPLEQLKFSVTGATQVEQHNLFESILESAADFRMLSAEVTEEDPFCNIPSLHEKIEERVQDLRKADSVPLSREWITTLGRKLTSISIPNDVKQKHVRSSALRLSQTKVQTIWSLKATPYIDDEPAGVSTSLNVLWKSHTLYLKSSSPAKIAHQIASELSRAFDTRELSDAIQMCYERDRAFILEYLEENFQFQSDVSESDIVVTDDEKEDTDKAMLDVDQGNLPVQDRASTNGGALSNKAIQNLADLTSHPLDGNSEVSSTTTEDDSVSSQRSATKPNRPNLIELFLSSKGYKKDGSERFYAENGCYVIKTAGSSFNWTHYDNDGQVVQRYFVRDHCLQLKPLSIDTENWSLCMEFPNQCALLLCDPDGNPALWKASDLKRLLENGQIELYPAKYRIVYNARSSR